MLDTVKLLRELQDDIPRANRPKNGAHYLGSIDRHTATNWEQECGFRVGTAGFADFAKKQLMKGEYARFTGKY